MNKYCGPYIVARLLHITPDQAARRVRWFRQSHGRRCYAVRGMYVGELHDILDEAGLKVGIVGRHKQKNGCYLTLAAWLRQYRIERLNRVFVVVLTGHFILVKGHKIYDNIHPEGVFLRKYPHRRARVRMFFHVSGLGRMHESL